MQELKQCPFCGGKAHMWSWNYGTRIDCENWNTNDAQAHFVGVSARTKEEAIEAWNRRMNNDEQVSNL